IANLLTIITVLVMLRYMYLIARRTLNVGPGGAVGIVVLDFAISLTIALVLASLLATGSV
ncbi:MAG: hypothetical protein GY798_31840, partial [Hyphomicrobiales bacterium]|nr:hypothetical protein [Hyphomicrobiales bacterium]